MEAIDVLLRIDRVDDGGRVEARGKRELNEDSVDVGVGGERLHAREQLGLRGRRGQANHAAAQARLVRRLFLVSHVDLARRIFSDQHDLEPRAATVRLREGFGVGLHFGAHARGDHFAVEDLGGHRVSLERGVRRSRQRALRAN